MTRSGYRTVLVALGVLAVALGGALFPPTGFGSAPAEETALVGPNPPPAGAADESSAGDAGEVEAVDAPATRTPAADDAGETPTPDEAPTATPTETQTPTPTPTPDRDDSGGLFGLFAGVATVTVLGVLAVVVASVLRSDDDGDGSDEGPSPLIPGLPVLDRLGGSPTDIVGRIPQVTMVALVGVSTGTTRVLGGAAGLANDVASGLSVAVRSGSRGLTLGLGGLGSLFSLPSGSLFSGVPSVFGGGGSGTASGQSPGTDARDAAPVEPESSEDPIESVADAWAAFAEPLPVRAPDARTPGEFARLAAERGDPDGPVERLTGVFRDVRYGGVPETAERTRSAVESVRAILAARAEEDDE